MLLPSSLESQQISCFFLPDTVGFCQCCLVMPVDTAIDRNRGRQVMVDDNVIRAMEGRLEMPDGEIHSWEKLSVILNREEPADYL